MESLCECSSPEEHQELVARVDESFKHDAERRRNAPTSESIRKNLIKHVAVTNGHSSHTVTV